ncbi:MAG: ankyrin repeat domain-containing protein, partial [Candidatus Wallbacteria bacterium]|nr:ankyrin repeat domain-containing protein [Candidatus Wallbacteria bacterium]
MENNSFRLKVAIILALIVESVLLLSCAAWFDKKIQVITRVRQEEEKALWMCKNSRFDLWEKLRNYLGQDGIQDILVELYGLKKFLPEYHEFQGRFGQPIEWYLGVDGAPPDNIYSLIAFRSSIIIPVYCPRGGTYRIEHYITHINFFCSCHGLEQILLLPPMPYKRYPLIDAMSRWNLGDTLESPCYKQIPELIGKGEDINASDQYQRTPLMLAISYRWDDIAAMLIEHGAYLTLTDRYGMNALHYAAKHKRLSLLKTLLDAGMDVNSRDRMGRTPLMYGCSEWKYGKDVDYHGLAKDWAYRYPAKLMSKIQAECDRIMSELHRETS